MDNKHPNQSLVGYTCFAYDWNSDKPLAEGRLNDTAGVFDFQIGDSGWWSISASNDCSVDHSKKILNLFGAWKIEP